MNYPDLLTTGKESPLHLHFAGMVDTLLWIAATISVFAILVMLVGVVRFFFDFVWAEAAGKKRIGLIDAARVDLGRYILSGLELFIVADIIETALSLMLADLLFLGLLVVIRSAISHFLGKEIEALRHRAPAMTENAP